MDERKSKEWSMDLQSDPLSLYYPFLHLQLQVIQGMSLQEAKTSASSL